MKYISGYTILVLTSMILALSSCGPEKEIYRIESAEELLSAVDSVMHSKIGELEPGAGVLIAYDGEMLVGKGYGLANYSARIPIRENTNFRMASVSKQFTAACVLRLVELRLLFLDQYVNDILGIDSLQGVQVRHLLYHTSGIPDYEPYFESGWTESVLPQNEDVLGWYAKYGKPEFEPGSRFEYSNGGYNLLASIVERVTNVPFEQFARQQVFLSTGMLMSLYYNLGEPVEIPNRAFCYEKEGDTWNQIDGNKLNGLLGEGGVYTSIKDYFQFDRAIRNEKLLSGEAKDLIFKGDAVDAGDASEYFDFIKPGSLHYAAGWFVQDGVAFHGGGWYGVSTFVLHEIDRPLTIAIFRNSSEPSEPLVNELFKISDSYVNYLESMGGYGD